MGKQRPGVMIYFSIRPSLKRLTLEEKGALFEAILDYGQTGALPEFDGVLGIAWDFIQPRIDRDGEQYQKIVEARREAANVRWHKQKMQMDANADFAMQTMPTTKPTSIPKSKTTSSSIPTVEGEYEGETSDSTCCQMSADTAEMGVRPFETPPPIDFEKQRDAKLKAFNAWCQKGGTG